MIHIAFVFMLAFAPAELFADVFIVPPVEYDDGTPLPRDDIARYDICISTSELDVCDEQFEVAGEVISSSEIPIETHHMKARTVTVYGEVGVYGEPLTGVNRKPAATEVELRRVTTTNSVTTTTVTTTE